MSLDSATFLPHQWLGRRNDFADATLRLFYVSAVPLLATALAALLIFLPRHPWRVTGRFSHREVPSGRILLATACAVAACALLMSAVNSGSLRFLNSEILSPRPFVTHRVNALVIEPKRQFLSVARSDDCCRSGRRYLGGVSARGFSSSFGFVVVRLYARFLWIELPN
jgi:hypothetical protein